MKEILITSIVFILPLFLKAQQNFEGNVQIAGNLITNGNVGIGTATPSVRLTVAGALNSEQSVVNFTNTANTDLQVKLSGPNATVKRTIIGPSTTTRLSFGVGINNNNEHLTIAPNGNVGIGTTSPNQKLTVNGTMYGKDVIVDLSVPGPDYVFEKNYPLPSLDSVKNYIDRNKHLPEVPPAREMEQNGINLSEMNMLLLKKVEELTLYMIELKSENQELKKRIDRLERSEDRN